MRTRSCDISPPSSTVAQQCNHRTTLHFTILQTPLTRSRLALELPSPPRHLLPPPSAFSFSSLSLFFILGPRCHRFLSRASVFGRILFVFLRPSSTISVVGCIVFIFLRPSPATDLDVHQCLVAPNVRMSPDRVSPAIPTTTSRFL